MLGRNHSSEVFREIANLIRDGSYLKLPSTRIKVILNKYQENSFV